MPALRRALVLPLLLLPLAGAPAPPKPVVIIGRDFVFDVPDTIPAGLTRFEFRNQGSETHEALLVRVPDEHSVAEIFAAVAADGHLPEWLQRAGGPNALTPGQSEQVVENLRAGNYVWFCATRGRQPMPHLRMGMLRAMVVTPAGARAGAEPPAAGRVRMTEFAYSELAPLAAGARWIRFDNAGTMAHEVVFFQLDPGKRLADLVAWQASRAGPRPAHPVGGIGALAPGAHAYLRLDVHTGAVYVMRCRIDADKKGKTHAQLGMDREVHVR